jgi:hypothetical protein
LFQCCAFVLVLLIGFVGLLQAMRAGAGLR